MEPAPLALPSLEFGEPLGAGPGASRRQKRVLLVALVLAVLFHLLSIETPIPWHTAPTAPVEVHTVNPAQLDTIRKQWRNRERSLLLDKNPRAAHDPTAPADARYESDRNIRVAKEQRARQTQVIPLPAQAPRTAAPPRPAPRAEAPANARPRSLQAPLALSQLGIPLHLGQRSEPRPRREQASAPSEGRTTSPGGDQAIDDRNLPEGSENLLNAQESVYYSFYARIYEALAPLWQRRIGELVQAEMGAGTLHPGTYRTLLEIVLDKDGNVVDVKKAQTSGVASFDEAGAEALHKIGRFANPPAGLITGDGLIHLHWGFIVDLSRGIRFGYAPPP